VFSDVTVQLSYQIGGMMRMQSHGRFWVAMCGAALGAGALLVGVPAAPVRAGQTCPVGQVEDASTPGFQCISSCPPGMLIDALTRTCVAAPGLPPPPLP
jgi:hypothetical protein